jgi:hypothetical protein
MQHNDKDAHMFSASDAKQLAGPTLEEKIESICESIKRLAAEKKRTLRAGYDHDADVDLWVYGGYSGTPEWLEAVKVLEGLGYKVSFFYEERQFVDMYTKIEW